MSDISIYDWTFAFLIVISFLMGILLVPSLISMKKLGFKNYIKQVRFLLSSTRKISDCYHIKRNITYNLGHNGRKIVDDGVSFFYPIFKDMNSLYIIHSKSGFFGRLDVSEHRYGANRWTNEYFEISTSTCLIRQMLIDRLKKKLTLNSQKSIPISSDEELNEVLNKEATSFRREHILEDILNG